MSVRTKFSIDYSISENSGGGKELGQTPPWTGTTDALDDGGTWRRRIIAGATDVLIDLNGLTTCRLLTLKTTQTITWKINNTSSTPITLRALGTGATDGVLFMTTDGVTAIYLSNAGTVDAEVTVTIAGII